MASSVAATGSEATACFARKISEERPGKCTSGNEDGIGGCSAIANAKVFKAELLLIGLLVKYPRRPAHMGSGF